MLSFRTKNSCNKVKEITLKYSTRCYLIFLTFRKRCSCQNKLYILKSTLNSNRTYIQRRPFLHLHLIIHSRQRKKKKVCFIFRIIFTPPQSIFQIYANQGCHWQIFGANNYLWLSCESFLIEAIVYHSRCS